MVPHPTLLRAEVKPKGIFVRVFVDIVMETATWS